MNSLFISPSNSNNHQHDCPSLNISDIIERECLSVLHKLHDQVNGLQLVQVVVQPLAKLFNPASLAALAASISQQQQQLANQSNPHHHSPLTYKTNNNSAQPNVVSASNNSVSYNHNNTTSHHINASTPSSYHSQLYDYDNATASSLAGPSNTGPAVASYNHSRSHSVASSFGVGTNITNISGSSSTASQSTYMMSPDTAQALIARLDTDRDVNWLMEIIGYGLSMPFSLTGEQDSVKDCCTIYCEWLASALLPYDENNEDSKYQQLSKLVPVPIRKDANRYARKMLSHLYNVFLPRQPTTGLPQASSTSAHANSKPNQKEESDAVLTAVSRQAVLCHRVLRTIEGIAHNQFNLMDTETWQHLLALLLTVNDKLLSPPTEQDDIGTQLHDRILGVLFDLMLLACSRSVPDANLWKTFHDMCMNWRHRPALVDHWRRISLQLTRRIVTLPINQSKNLYNTTPQHLGRSGSGIQQQMNIDSCNSQNPIELAIASMNYENLSQSWYRFLNLIGNPVELADPIIISRTDEFYHAACSANSVLDPRQHPCLNVLPQVFHNSMLGLKEFIETFIKRVETNRQHGLSAPQTTIPSGRNQIPLDQHQQQQNQSSINAQLTLNPDRPRCNSLLHIFGDWLFSAALIGSDLTQELDNLEQSSTDQMLGSTLSVASSNVTATESGLPPSDYSPLFRRRQSHQSTASSHTSMSSTNRSGRRSSKQLESNSSALDRITLEPPLSADSFESGQAEAMSALCKIFSSKMPNEDILPSYLARFYLCLQHCLDFGTGLDNSKRQSDSSSSPPGPIKRQLLASVLTNATTLLQHDLDGMNLLIPSLIKTVEYVFECSEQDIPICPPPRQHASRSGSVRQTSNPANSQAYATNSELKRACITTLVNLLSHPLHFQDLAIRSCLDANSPTLTFSSFRPRLLKLLFIALQTEKDVTNMQILFGGLSLAIHDLVSNKMSIARSARGSTRPHHTGDSEHSSLDVSNNPSSANKPAAEDTISQSSFVFNSSDGFLIKSLHVTCHLLINIWKHDNLVSLAALEVLTTIARISIQLDLPSTNDGSLAAGNNNNIVEMKNEYMQTTKWICDYICNQCSRPPPAHSRDMHSTIVAAYQCLSVWFYNHPYLLRDNQCINTVLEVIELGVSGQKSKSSSMNSAGATIQSIITKSEKQLKPSSMRVREAAESLLNVCMVRTCTDGPSNIALCDSVLNELDIVEYFGAHKYGPNSRIDNETKRLELYKTFKYFSDDDSMILSLFEIPNQYQSNQTDLNTVSTTAKDSVICLIRTAFGKHCWRIKFNYYSEKSKDKIIANKTLGIIKRPFHQQAAVNSANVNENRPVFSFPKGHNRSLYFNMSAKFFPDSIEESSSTELDRLVTTLDEYVAVDCASGDPSKQMINSLHSNASKFKNDLDKMSKIFAHQVQAEQKVISECSVRVKRMVCDEPQQMQDLELARLIVTQLGLETTLNSMINGGGASQKFVDSLRELDSQSIRACDSIHIFYVRKNRTEPIEILESARSRHNVSVEFFEWLFELGQPVVIKDHNRWNGRVYDALSSLHATGQHRPQEHNTMTTNATNNTDGSLLSRNQMLASDHGGAIFDGQRMVLYWSDMCQELAFLVPHRPEKATVNIVIYWLESHDDLASIPTDPTSILSRKDNSTATTAPEVDQPTSQQEEAPTAISDHSSLKSGISKSASATNGSSKELIKYYISPLRSGLFKVNLVASCNRQWLALPLVDGMTVSKGMLASLIRESILNLCRRKRLDADSYQQPHVKRRLKLQEICNNYKISSRSESSDFYFNLFRGKNPS